MPLQVPEKYRLVFVLREVEDLSVKETAEVLLLEESNSPVEPKTIFVKTSPLVKENVIRFSSDTCDRRRSCNERTTD
jgi:RNA polymerase sigma-70 factor (ECF subfamily)